MSRVKLVLGGLVVATLVSVAQAGWLTPELRRKLDRLNSGDRVSVIVHMAERPKFSQFPSNARREKITYLKSLAARSQSGARVQAQGLGADSLKPFWVFNGFGMKATKEATLMIAGRQDVEFVSENANLGSPPGPQGPVQPPQQLEWNISRVQAPDVWNLGYKGEGIVLCIFDTGVWEDHVAFNNPFPKWRSNNGWFDPVNGTTRPTDGTGGHGTHVAGLAIGGDIEHGYPSIGVAYRAQYIGCVMGGYLENHLNFQWIASLVDLGCPPDIVNCSWGDYFSDPYGTSLEFWNDLLTLRELGILPVFCIGNSQPGPTSPPNWPPGNYPIVFGVGATDQNDLRGVWGSNNEFWSLMGPSPEIYPWNDSFYWGRPDVWWPWGQPEDQGLIKPDIGAPGAYWVKPAWGILSAKSRTSSDYWTMNGSSQGTPHVSGALALLLQASRAQWHYDLNYYDLYDLLLEGADRTTYPSYPNNETGWGRLNCLNSVDGVLNFHLKSSSHTATGPNNGDRVAYGGGKWHLVYETGGPLGKYIRYTVSTDNGATWTQEANSPTGDPIGKIGEGGSPALSVVPSGNAHVVWGDGNLLRYSQKLAASPTWTVPVTLYNIEGIQETPSLVVDPATGIGHVAFVNASVFGRSVLYGSFDTQNPVLNTLTLDAGDVSHPAIGLGADGPHVAWRKKASPKTKPGIYYACASEGWTIVQLSGSGITCEHPDLVVSPYDQTVLVAWERGEGSATDVWARRKISGLGWQVLEQVCSTSEESRHPVIAANAYNIHFYAAWSDSTPDNDWEILANADYGAGWELGPYPNLSNTPKGSKNPQIGYLSSPMIEGTMVLAFGEGSSITPPNNNSKYVPVYEIKTVGAGLPFGGGGGGQSAGQVNRPAYRSALLGCYPNPMAAEATVAYEIAKPTPASLRIYNVAGQVVRSLVEGKVEPGHYEAVWDGKDASGRKVGSGIYFYRLEAGSYSKTNKLVVVR